MICPKGFPAPLISIHAPRTGSDLGRRRHRRAAGAFQSTLPARGATAPRVDLEALRQISIHAPRTGSDATNHGSCFPSSFQSTLPARGATWERVGMGADRTDFNPRSPHGERRGIVMPQGRTRAISIHAPRTGSDPTDYAHDAQSSISIHAPRTGSDTAKHPDSPRGGHFNPRSPHGERRRGASRETA